MNLATVNGEAAWFRSARKEMERMRVHGKSHGHWLLIMFLCCCLLGASAAPALSGYLVSGNTVSDTDSGLMWMLADNGSTATWTQALEYCENLAPSDPLAGSFSDWRLPNINELHSLVDLRRSSPAIDVSVFPDCLSESYWSSTPGQQVAVYAWYVSFGAGSVGYQNTDQLMYVRCVRDLTY